MWMTLIFMPADRKRSEFSFEPNPLKPTQDIGPVPDGTYEVGLISWGFKVRPARKTIVVGEGKAAEADFALRPQGMLGGYVTLGLKSEDRYWGFMPSIMGQVRIIAVHLKGPGVDRRIVQQGTDYRQSLEAFFDGMDYIYKDWFCFFALPAGDYKVTVEAEDCTPSTQSVSVVPKTPNYLMYFRISPQ
jgi:hypothetical protein